MTKKQYLSEYYKKNKDRLALVNRAYALKNKDKVDRYNKKYREKNRISIRERARKWYADHKEEIKVKESIKRKSKVYCRKRSLRQIAYNKKRRHEDNTFRLRHNFRVMFKNRMKRGGYNKTMKMDIILGCSFLFFLEHIEKQFTDDMSWGNYGFYGWHIDHIVPLSSAKTEKEFYKLWHYSNMQPLWAKDNLKKGVSLKTP